jgi:hypothetical protein
MLMTSQPGPYVDMFQLPRKGHTHRVELWAKKWFVDVIIAKMDSILFSLSTKKETVSLHMG